jgi:hypothetical protein
VPSLRNLIKAGAGDFWGHGGHGFLSLKSPWGVLGVFFQFSASHSSGKKPHINRGIYIPTWDKAVKNTRHWFNYSSGVFLFPFFFACSSRVSVDNEAPGFWWPPPPLRPKKPLRVNVMSWISSPRWILRTDKESHL